MGLYFYFYQSLDQHSFIQQHFEACFCFTRTYIIMFYTTCRSRQSMYYNMSSLSFLKSFYPWQQWVKSVTWWHPLKLGMLLCIYCERLGHTMNSRVEWENSNANLTKESRIIPSWEWGGDQETITITISLYLFSTSV